MAVLLILYQVCFIPLLAIVWLRKPTFQLFFEYFPVNGVASIALSLLSIYLVYILLINRIQKLGSQTYSITKTVWLLSPLVISVVAFFPIFSRDLIAYLAYARNLLDFGANPYSYGLSSVIQNTWISFVTVPWWANSHSVYGPLLHLITLFIPFFSGSNLYLAGLIYKIINLGIFVISLIFLRKLLIKLYLNPNYYLIYALNPNVIINGLLEGHNDLMVASALITSIYLAWDRKSYLSALTLVAGVAIKSHLLVLVPFFLVFEYKQNYKECLKWLWGLMVGYLGILIIWYLTLLVFSQRPLSLKPMGNVDLSYLFTKCYLSCPPWWGFDQTLTSVTLALRVLLASSMFLYMLFKLVKHPDQLIKNLYLTITMVVYVVFSFIAPWYILPVTILGVLFYDNRLGKVWFHATTIYALTQLLGLII